VFHSKSGIIWTLLRKRWFLKLLDLRDEPACLSEDFLISQCVTSVAFNEGASKALRS